MPKRYRQGVFERLIRFPIYFRWLGGADNSWQGKAMKKLGGWWRLWIALSVIWTITVLIVIAVSAHQYTAGERRRDAVALHCIGSFNGQSIDWTTVPAEKIEAAINAVAQPGSVTSAQSTNATQAPASPSTSGWGPVAKVDNDPVDLMLAARATQGVDADEGKQFLTSCLEAKRHDYEPDVIRQRNADILATLGIISIPPLVLLVLGLVFSWIMAGFRKTQSHS